MTQTIIAILVALSVVVAVGVVGAQKYLAHEERVEQAAVNRAGVENLRRMFPTLKIEVAE